jgi:AraC-like DNA-binding protein
MIPENWLLEQEILSESIWRKTMTPEQAVFPLFNRGLRFREILFELFECETVLTLLKNDTEISLLFREWILEELALVISDAIKIPKEEVSLRRLPRFEIVHNAVELIEEYLQEPFSTGDLAAKMDISPRLLQYAFQETCNVTPLRYIMHRKLHAARNNLIHTVPNNSSQVAQVAMLYGINHLGRFSNNYKNLFKESPSTTLRRKHVDDVGSFKNNTSHIYS